MSEESESYRLRMLRYLKDRYGEAKPAKVLEAEKVIAKFREEKTRHGEAITRLNAPLPEPNLRPECWFMHGRRSLLDAREHPNPKKYDRFACRQCGHVEDRRANPYF